MKETTIAVILLLLLVAVLNPFHFWMPSMVQMIILVLILIAFSLFAIFVLREQVVDEREGLHRMLAGRVAFLAGGATLIVGIIMQTLKDSLDSYLVVALVVMIVAKIGTRLYTDRNK